MGKTITTYLIYENQYGPKTIEIKNWVGKAVYSPISNLPNLLNEREEFCNPGIYFLKSQSSKDIYTEKIYVGESENVKERLSKHLVDANKEFEECIIFTSKDDMLTKSHIRYLEAKSINLIKELNSVELENKNIQKLPSLPETDISDMDYFFKEIGVIMPLAGFNCFKSNTVSISEDKSKLSNNKIKDSNITFYINREDIKANAIENEDGFIVLEGSTCKKKHNNSIKKDRITLKKKLIESKILKEQGNTYVFEEDTIFNSSSQAASIILGAQTSGPQTWKTKDDKTYQIIMENKLKLNKL